MSPLTETFGKLLESLQPYPQMQFLLFSGEWGAPERRLLEFCEARDHRLMLYRLPGGPEAPPPENERIRLRPWRREQSRYNLQGRLYNHAFVTALPPEEPETFAAKVYTGIANAGGLYLFVPLPETRKWEEVLSQSNYVAISRIEEREGLCLLAARKMHGWGG